MADGKEKAAAVKCSPAERMLLESRRAAAQELYERADALLAEAADAVLASHNVERGNRIPRLVYQDGQAFVVLVDPEQIRPQQSAPQKPTPPDPDAPPPLEPAPADEPVEAATAA